MSSRIRTILAVVSAMAVAAAMMALPASALAELSVPPEAPNAPMAPSTQGYVGLLLGPSFVNQSVGTNFLIGGHIGAKLASWFGLGFYGTYQSLISDSASSGGVSIGASASETILAVEPDFYLLRNDSLYLGAKVGVGITSVSVNGSGIGDSLNLGASQTNFAAGPALGCNFKLVPNFSIGAEVNAIWVFDGGGSNNLNLINVLGQLTYWF